MKPGPGRKNRSIKEPSGPRNPTVAAHSDDKKNKKKASEKKSGGGTRLCGDNLRIINSNPPNETISIKRLNLKLVDSSSFFLATCVHT